MAIVLVSVQRDITRRKRRLVIQGTVSGNYVTGGIPVDWTTVTNPKMLPGGRPRSNPLLGEVLNTPGGYSAEFIPGTTMKNWLLKVYTGGGAELAAAAFPGALIAAPFQFEVQGALGAF